MPTPNTLAYVMLLAWPLVSWWLFRRLSVGQAVIWTILGGYLLLPPVARFEVILLPDLDKVTIPNICAYLGFALSRQTFALPKSRLIRLALAFYVLTPIGTVLSNLDFIPFATRGGLAEMTLQQIPSDMLSNVIMALPALIAYQAFRDEKSMRELLVALVLAGLAYSIPMLVEIRLSPQINVWIYGFFQHAFDQTMRYGGFRPVVFLPHGLWVAFFAFMAALSAITLLRAEPATRLRTFILSVYLLVVLVLCKSANAVTYIVLLAPVVLLLTSKAQIRLAAVVAAIVLVYPVLRGAGLIPTEAIADFARSIDPDRAGSLVYRLVNEDALLKHASDRPWFGWGGWDRSLVHDMITGRMLTAIDGQWIITLGMSGWFGYLGEFGLLALPPLLLAIGTRGKTQEVSAYAAALALILSANLVDLVPNATLIPFTWLMAGALLGYAEVLSASRTDDQVRSRFTSLPPWARSTSQT